MCSKCRAVFSYVQSYRNISDAPFNALVRTDNGVKCHICGYTASHLGGYTHIPQPQEMQIKGLGQIASKLPPHSKLETIYEGEYLNLLIDAISKSKNFINFLTYNIDTTFLSLLYLASRFTSVRGIVAGTPWNSENGGGNFNRSLLETFHDTTSREMDFAMLVDNDIEENHTKLVIIDGLLAFGGSVNLSYRGYKKASKGKELPLVESNPDKVIEMNNSYFANQWTKLNELEDNFPLEEDLLPFDEFPPEEDLPF